MSSTPARVKAADAARILQENEKLRADVRRVERRLAKAGERGQVRSAYSLAIQQLGLPNPEKLRADDYAKMLEDPQVLAGSTIVKLAILAKEGRFNYHPHDKDSEEEKLLGERVVGFLEWQKSILSASPGDWNQFLENVLSAIDYGYSVTELVWNSRRDPLTGRPELVPSTHPAYEGLLFFSRAKLLPHASIENNGIAADPYGGLTAVYQSLGRARVDAQPAASSVPQAPETTSLHHRIPFIEPGDLDRLILFTPRAGAGNLYGTSELKAAYEHWYAKRYNHTARNILLERLSGVVILKPGNPNQDQALEDAGNNMSVGGVTILPEGAEVELLKGWEQAIQGFHEALRYDDIMILRALLVPNETVGGDNSDVGSMARANSHLDSFLMGIKHRRTKLEEVIEESIVRLLVEANWGKLPGTVTFDFDELEEEDREKLARIYQNAIGMGIADPAIDAAEMRRELALTPAPAGHTFQRLPPPGAAPFGGALPSGEVARAASKPPAWDASVGQDLDYFEAVMRNALKDAFDEIARDVAASIPDAPTPSQLDEIDVDAERIATALDTVMKRIGAVVWTDVARQFRQRGVHEAAERLARAEAPLSARVRALEPDDPLFQLNSYLASVGARNKEEAERMADDVRHRLRRRILQAFAKGFAHAEVVRGIRDEFAAYTEAQIGAVTHTTVMDHYNSARRAAFDAAGDYVLGVRLVRLADAHNTPFCRAIDGRTISKRDPLYARVSSPPYWYRCRTIAVPILRDEEGVVFDADWPQWLASHRDVDGGGFLYAHA